MDGEESIERLPSEGEYADGRAALDLGNYYAGADEWELAEEQYRKALNLGNREARHWLGLALYKQQRLVEAESVYREAIAEGDMGVGVGATWAWHGLGMLLRDQGRLEEAVDVLKAAVTGGRTAVHRDLVDLYLEMGRVKDAEREYLTAIEAGDAESYLNLGFLYEDLQRFDEAERHYRAAIHAGVARAHISLGNLLDKLGRPSDAEKEYRLAMFARADMPNAAYNLAVSLEKQGREEEAIEGYRTAAYLGFKPARWIIADRERRRSEGRDGMDVWIGLVDLKAAPGNYLFEGAAGAWTNACAPARDENEYRHAVEAAFRDMALEVVKIENIVRFRERVPGLDPNAEMFDIAARVARTSRVAYDYFHLHGLQEK